MIVKNFILILNLIGVLVLGVLCVSQWRINRQLHGELDRLEEVRREQAAKLDERDRTINGQASDLGALREHLTRVTGGLHAAEERGRQTARQLAQLESEREQLQAGVRKWAEAVEARDEQLRATHAQLREVVGQTHETVTKYNELAANYSALVETLNDRTRQYNELVTKYNELARK